MLGMIALCSVNFLHIGVGQSSFKITRVSKLELLVNMISADSMFDCLP